MIINRCIDDVGGSYDVGLDCFKGVIFSRWDLFQRRRVNHIVDAAKGTIETIFISYIAKQVTQKGEITNTKALLHLKLLQLISTKNDEPSRLVIINNSFYKLLPEGTCSSCDENAPLIE